MSSTPFNLAKESKVKGIVKSVTEFGVALDVLGCEGLLQISDIGWWGGGSPDLQSLFKEGDELETLVLAVDEGARRASLSLKQLVLYPWDKVTEKYPVGRKLKCKVTRFTNYGAVVLLEPWVEGLLPVDEISWTKRRSPNVALKINQEIDVVVIQIKDESQLIHLSARQAVPNPWDEIGKRYPVGSTVKAVVWHVFADGAYLDIDNGIDGVIHFAGKSWSRPSPANEILKKGDTIEAIVHSIEKEKCRVSLTIKKNDQTSRTQ